MTFRKKLVKLISKPGLFFRDALNNRYPLIVDDRISYVKSSNFASKTIVEKGKVKHTATKQSATLPESTKWDNVTERLSLNDYPPVSFPIDFVFTWVDSDDPEFITQYNQFSSESDKRLEVSDMARFQSLDELKYAIRSIFEYAPWFRKIYIVTNGQCPQWLVKQHPKIAIIYHKDILEEEYLPTFNSHVIESALHKIPGLAEHYIYLNDDMMLTRPVSPNYFFSGTGLMYLFVSKALLPDSPVNDYYDTPTEWGAKNARKLIFEYNGYYPNQMFAHTFYPQLKSVAEENECRWPEYFDLCRKNRFRAKTDIFCTGFLHSHVAHFLGKAVFTKTRLFYFNVRMKSARNYYKMLLQKKGTLEAPVSMCCNDRLATDGDDFPNYADHLLDCLVTYYPRPSPVEQDLTHSEQSITPQNSSKNMKDKAQRHYRSKKYLKSSYMRPTGIPRRSKRLAQSKRMKRI